MVNHTPEAIVKMRLHQLLVGWSRRCSIWMHLPSACLPFSYMLLH